MESCVVVILHELTTLNNIGKSAAGAGSLISLMEVATLTSVRQKPLCIFRSGAGFLTSYFEDLRFPLSLGSIDK